MKVTMRKVLTEVEEKDIKDGILTISEDIDEIEMESCLVCPEVTTVIFPKNLKHIGKFAFYDCANLNILKFSSAPQIEYDAFADCPIDTVIIPADIQGVELDEFYCALKKAINNNFKLFIEDGGLASEKDKFGNPEEPENE